MARIEPIDLLLGDELMKKPIKKNLTDQDMLAGCKEEGTFETGLFKEDQPKAEQTKTAAKNERPPAAASSFFSKELQEDVNKALLELKIKLYQEGILDYNLKVSQEGRQVILTALPVVLKAQKH